MRLSFFLLVFVCSNSFGQINNYQNLLDTALRNEGNLFVYHKPSTIETLDRKLMFFYIENVEDYSKRKLDTAMFSEIIANSKKIDTTPWTENELKKSLLIHRRAEAVSNKYAIEKLKLTDRKQIRHFTKLIRAFNSTEASDRIIFYYSRPVFDNSKKFAIVQWENGHNYFAGGGGIILYELKENMTWEQYGVIVNWRH